MIYEWVIHAIEKLRTQRESQNPTSCSGTTSDETDFCAADVNRFVGFGIRSLRDKFSRKYQDDDDDEVKDFREMLIDIGAMERDVIDNEEYVRRYYLSVDRIFNRGWLTLVAPHHVSWAHDLMIAISKRVARADFKEKKNAVAREARLDVRRDLKTKILPEMYAALTKSLGESVPCIETAERLLNMLCDKTFNARFGFALKLHRSENLQRGSQHGNNTAFRTELSVKTQSKK